MKKSSYFIIQIIWSFILSSAVWYLIIKNSSFDFYHNSDDTIAGIILIAGLAVYLILTVVYLVIGYRKVKGWRPWIIPVSVVLAAAMAFGGFFGAGLVLFAEETLNRTLSTR
ncbi:MAG: hypothetical protein J5778_04665 [Clostridiales bacterium]|nr:hypothetical protein [Clostridiales bacterium]